MNDPFDQAPNLRTTQLFMACLDDFRYRNMGRIAYTVIKFVASLIIVILRLSVPMCDYQLVDLWLIIVAVLSVLNLACYVNLDNQMRNITTIAKIAKALSQVVYIPNNDNNVYIPLNEQELTVPIQFEPRLQQTEKERKKQISIISQQIRYEASNISWKRVGQLAFVLNQILIVTGFVLEVQQPFFDLNSSSQECNEPTLIFLYIFTLISFYEYGGFYILLAIFILLLPFLLIYLLVKYCQKRKVNNEFALKLEKNEMKFAPGMALGDPECSICMQNYNLDDKIIALPCNANHNFHKTCIFAWLKVSLNCPLCRKDFSEQDNNIEQPLVVGH